MGACNKAGLCPIHLAAASSQTPPTPPPALLQGRDPPPVAAPAGGLLRVLLENGADPNSEALNDKRTPLHVAAACDSAAAALLLLQKGAKVSSQQCILHVIKRSYTHLCLSHR